MLDAFSLLSDKYASSGKSARHTINTIPLPRDRAFPFIKHPEPISMRDSTGESATTSSRQYCSASSPRISVCSAVRLAVEKEGSEDMERLPSDRYDSAGTSTLKAIGDTHSATQNR